MITHLNKQIATSVFDVRYLLFIIPFWIKTWAILKEFISIACSETVYLSFQISMPHIPPSVKILCLLIQQ